MSCKSNLDSSINKKKKVYLNVVIVMFVCLVAGECILTGVIFVVCFALLGLSTAVM